MCQYFRRVPVKEDMSSTVDSVNVSSSRHSDVGDISPKVRTVSVETANNKNGRLWDKKHCCLFCTKMYPKLPRHLEQIHSTEVEVAAALAFPKKSKERKLRWDDLRNRGNFCHNTQVIKKGSGGIVPYRRPALDTDAMTAYQRANEHYDPRVIPNRCDTDNRAHKDFLVRKHQCWSQRHR